MTGDDAMPDEHEDVIERLGVTVATVDGRWEHHGMEQEAYKREVVHRWAHRMAEQQDGEVRRYSPSSNRTWTRRQS
ncbi:hypothetical protein BH23ACT9_BH23ACT9_32660 [soil metagenome]